jgi:hypothetical protein
LREEVIAMARLRSKLYTVLLAVAMLNPLLTAQALATEDSSTAYTTIDIRATVWNFVSWVSGIVALFLTLVLIWIGIDLMRCRDANRREELIHRLGYAFGGFFICVAAWTIAMTAQSWIVAS